MPGSTQDPQVLDGNRENGWKKALTPCSADWARRLQELRSVSPERETARLVRDLLTELETEVLGTRDPEAAVDLSRAGWGIVFADGADPRLEEALVPLIELRQSQAGKLVPERFRVYRGKEGYVDGLCASEFRESRGGALGAVDPDLMPYYILLVGEPSSIPFGFQFQLDIPHAVGRLAFDRWEDYRRYAEGVVAHERTLAEACSDRALTLFGPCLPEDDVTKAMSEILIGELRDSFEQSPETGWQVRTVTGSAATKDHLGDLLREPGRPDLLFTATHGMGYSPRDRGRRDRQGGLVCHGQQEPWPVFDASDVGERERLSGSIAVHYGCHTGGVPGPRATNRPGLEQPPGAGPFVARLPQRLLGHPRGGALAVLAHVGRSYGYSFVGPGKTIQTYGFEDVLRRLMKGGTAGWAMEVINVRFAQLTAQFWEERDREAVSGSDSESSQRLLELFNSIQDAERYLVLGDPAVRLWGGNP